MMDAAAATDDVASGFLLPPHFLVPLELVTIDTSPPTQTIPTPHHHQAAPSPSPTRKPSSQSRKASLTTTSVAAPNALLFQNAHAKVYRGQYCGTDVALVAYRPTPAKARLWKEMLDTLATLIVPNQHPVRHPTTPSIAASKQSTLI